MAVYDRTWRPYAGPLLPRGARFLVIARHAAAFVFQSRLFTSFFVGAALVWPAACAIYIYLRYNARALELLQVDISKLVPADAVFFHWFLQVQGLFFGFVVALFAGPGLVSRDMTHGGLPLLLTRPFTRWEYLAGKATVLLALLSLVTWIPGFLLFSFQAALARGSWLPDHLGLLFGIALGSWIWIVFLTLVVLGFSALVRRRLLGGLLFLGVFLAVSAAAAVLLEITQSRWTACLHPFWAGDRVIAGLLGAKPQEDLPLLGALAALALWSLLSFWLLHRKVRAYEVSR